LRRTGSNSPFDLDSYSDMIYHSFRKEILKMKKFVVIGGQYEQYCYGQTDSLQAAKTLATKHEEYWDNWQGWRTPQIYRGEDCETVEARGMITHRDGEEIVIRRPGACPAFVKTEKGWREFDAMD
jgi:hypothetical protein